MIEFIFWSYIFSIGYKYLCQDNLLKSGIENKNLTETFFFWLNDESTHL